MTPHAESVRPGDRPHRRFNPLTGCWVLVSPQRTERPWHGRIEPATPATLPRHDPGCYLCPGNRRAGGAVNPRYRGVHVFENDFSALLPDPEAAAADESLLLRREPVQGICRVLCFSPRHDLTLALMKPEEILQVVDLWVAQTHELAPRYRWVQIFENRGEIMGCSNPHPHGQLWAGSALPNEPAAEDLHQRRYFERSGKALLADYLDAEAGAGTRLVVSNEHWTVVVPYWAVWPFETLLLPQRRCARLTDLEPDERTALADILKRLLTRYDNLFETSFPYTMGWHGAPNGSGDDSHWQLHAHFYPPLLRSATIRKFMVGYEMLAEPQRDITAELAAERLRVLPEVHYTLRAGGSAP